MVVFSFRSAFLAAHIPLFLYPFLHTVSKTRPFEYLRLTSLGVIGKLFYYFCFDFLEMVSCSIGWPQAHYVPEDTLEFFSF